MAVIHANSLATITSLAAGPPSNPRQYPPAGLGQLILYIAKVPGSKDVFLTPLKPRQKVVTVEDIQSSLYYFHINSADDDHSQNETRSAAQLEQRAHHEEPLYYDRRDNRPDDQLSHHPLPPLPTELPSSLRAGQNVGQQIVPPTYSRQEQSTIPYRDCFVEPSAPPKSYVVHRKPLSMGPRLQVNTQSLPTGSSRLDHDGDHSWPARTIQGSYADPAFKITVIRRDPSSGQQWNVATIIDPATFDVGSQSTLLRRKGQPVHLELYSPGYLRFAEPEDNGLVRSSMPTGQRFERRLHMEGSVLGNLTMHRKSVSTEPVSPSLPLRSEAMGRASFDSSLQSRSDQSTRSLQLGSGVVRSKTRNYTFMSPWNTRCEFLSGAGHSMRCRHSLPDASRLGGVDSVQVSELRFNLPGGGPLASPTEKENPSSRRARFLARTRESQDDVYPEEDTSDRLDLTLGKEMAGGGFAGKQAKLGKLIIEPEGIKMLDLLVAANMALWWRAYEKT